MDCASSGSYLLLFDHNRRSSQLFFLAKARFLHHFTRSCGVSLKAQSRLTKSRCSNISHFLALLGIPCSTVHHFDCSASLPPCPNIFLPIKHPTGLHFLHRQGLSSSFVSSSHPLKVILLAWSFVIQHYLRNSKYHDFYRHRISSCPEGHTHATSCI